ncbi:MAG: SURF1 family protein [Pseudomonadota bacterium]
MTERSTRLRHAWPLVLYFILCPTMIWLGFWQLGKSEQRAEALAIYETQLESDRIVDAALVRADREFVAVRAVGQFIDSRQVLIDNIVRNGRAGCFVLARFELLDGQSLVVNRGWVPLTAQRDVDADLTLPTGDQVISGRVGRLPSGGLRLGDNPTTSDTWPLLMVFPTLSELEALLDAELADWVLLETENTIDASPFEREWTPGGLPPERHMGYAVQWFAMAIALTLLMVFAWRRTRSKQTREPT